jgi:hypothetical protein
VVTLVCGRGSRCGQTDLWSQSLITGVCCVLSETALVRWKVERGRTNPRPPKRCRLFGQNRSKTDDAEEVGLSDAGQKLDILFTISTS